MAIQTKTQSGDDGRITVSFSDSINLVKKQVKWSPKGVSLLTKWPFQVGAEVEFAFDHEGARHCCTGLSSRAHPLRRPLGFFETVLYFVETPCTALQKAACACQLTQERELAESDGHVEMEEASRDGAVSPARTRSVRR